MERIQLLKTLINQRLHAAAEEICGFFESTVITYEEEINRQRKLLDTVSERGHRGARAEEVPLTLHQENPDLQRVKSEEEEQWAGQSEAQRLGQREDRDIKQSPIGFTVKTEDEEDTQLPQFHPSQTENRTGTADSRIKSEPESELGQGGVLEPAAEPSHPGQSTEPSRSSWLFPSMFSNSQRNHSAPRDVFREVPSRSDPFKPNSVEPTQPSSICESRSSVVPPDQPSESVTFYHTGEENVVHRGWARPLAEGRHRDARTKKSAVKERPFSCTVCGKAFGKKGNLNVHMRNHTGEKPFSCSYCGESFRTRSTLKVHTRRHSGEKPFSCPVCGKRFRQSSTVRIHMRIHTGEKPFCCAICGKRFSESGMLKRHTLTHNEKT